MHRLTRNRIRPFTSQFGNWSYFQDF